MKCEKCGHGEFEHKIVDEYLHCDEEGNIIDEHLVYGSCEECDCKEMEW